MKRFCILVVLAIVALFNNYLLIFVCTTLPRLWCLISAFALIVLEICAAFSFLPTRLIYRYWKLNSESQQELIVISKIMHEQQESTPEPTDKLRDETVGLGKKDHFQKMSQKSARPQNQASDANDSSQPVDGTAEETQGDQGSQRDVDSKDSDADRAEGDPDNFRTKMAKGAESVKSALGK